MPIATKKFDVQNYLKTPRERASYLDAALDDGDPALIAAALGDIAKAEGMTAVARNAGLTREGLYKALSSDGDPRLSTLMGVTRALGIKLTSVRRSAAPELRKPANKPRQAKSAAK